MSNIPYKAPGFSLKNESNKTVSLSNFEGKWLILYFYPKDDTPGCTIEACSIRDARDDLISLGAEVVGVSKDGINSHEKFRAKHQLNFTLLSDVDGKVINDYGAWGKKMFGREGIQRKTFIIDPKGIVRKVYGRVTPVGHGEKLLSDLRLLQSE